VVASFYLPFSDLINTASLFILTHAKITYSITLVCHTAILFFRAAGMHLVNTFEERFDDLDGYSEEHALVKLLASSMSNSVVSLASFESNELIIQYLLREFHTF